MTVITNEKNNSYIRRILDGACKH